MSDDFRTAASQSIHYARSVNQSLIEKALAMRCSSYLSQVKAQLLTQTIYEVDHSKKMLSSLNTRLQDEIAERKRVEVKLQAAKEQADAATELKDKFVAMVSHDLKSPLMVIGTLVGMLDDRDDLSQEARELVVGAQMGCERMASMVESISAIGRVRNGKIRPKCARIQISSLLTSLVNSFLPVATNKGIQLTCEVDSTISIYADQTLLLEMLENLVSNAIKFCREGDTIRLHVPSDQPSTIVVSDTGVGIAEDRIGTLFDYEEHTSTRGTAGEAGTGMGLPLAHEIAAAHGGKLEVDSSPGRGSSFYVRLPAQPMI